MDATPIEQAEQPRFKVKEAAEQRHFENPAVQGFFSKWFEANDSIRPEYIDRQQWEEKQGNILAKGIEGDKTKTLFIPRDLQLWEMVGVMEVVDKDTFKDNPERQSTKAEELRKLGRTIRNAGVYIAQRLEGIDQGKSIASALAEEFYEYGSSLSSGQKPQETIKADKIATSHNLTTGEINEVDRFLAGENLYEKRVAKAKVVASRAPYRKDEIFEAVRQRTLNQFFRVAEKAFGLQQKVTDGEITLQDSPDRKPWQSDTPYYQAFLDKINASIERVVNMPKTELTGAVFKRGLQKLVSEMRQAKDTKNWRSRVNNFFESMRIDLRLEQKKLTEVLKIPQLRTELALVRESGDVTKIAAKEREIADKIQGEVSKVLAREESDIDTGFRPTEIIETEFLDCVGYSTLGGALMQEAGLHYLVADNPVHSFLLLVTSDNQVEIRDMQQEQGHQLTDDTISASKLDGSPVKIADIAALINQKSSGLFLNILQNTSAVTSFWVKEGEPLSLFTEGEGEELHVLFRLALALMRKNLPEESIEACRQALAINPQNPHMLHTWGINLSFLRRYEEAIPVFRKAIELNDKDKSYYLTLCLPLLALGRVDEAAVVQRRYLELADPESDKDAIDRLDKGFIKARTKTANVIST